MWHPSVTLCQILLCFSDLVVASPVEDYFLYIDDLPYPEKVRIYGLVSFFFNQIESFNVIHLIINDSKKLRIFSSLEVCGKNDDFFPLDFIFLFSVEEMNLYDF